MISLPVLALSGLLALASANEAPESRDSPTDVLYRVRFSEKNFLGGMAFWSDNGYVTGAIGIIGYQQGLGPFEYEISEQNVPIHGECADAGDTLNPYDGTLDAESWAQDAVGDLSGKHGKFNVPFYHKMYDDPFLSLNTQNEAYIGDKALVVFTKDGNIYTCGNLEKIQRSGKTVGSGDNKIPIELADILPQNVTQALISTPKEKSKVDLDAGAKKVNMPLSAGAKAVRM